MACVLYVDMYSTTLSGSNKLEGRGGWMGLEVAYKITAFLCGLVLIPSTVLIWFLIIRQTWRGRDKQMKRLEEE